MIYRTDIAYRGQPVIVEESLFIYDERSDQAGVDVRNGLYMPVVEPAKERYTNL